MITQELIDFIKEQLSAGKSRIEISEMLVKNGWKATDVDEGFNAAAPSVAPSMMEPIVSQPVAQPVAQPIAQPAIESVMQQPVQPAAQTYSNPVYSPGARATTFTSPEMVTATPQIAQVPPKKAWLKFVIGFIVIVVLAIAAYFGYGYYKDNYAQDPSDVTGVALANLIEAKDVSFKLSVASTTIPTTGMSGIIPVTQTGAADATISSTTLPAYSGLITISGSITLDTADVDVSVKDETGMFDITARSVGGMTYIKSSKDFMGFPVNQWISLKQGEAPMPINVSSEQLSHRQALAKALRSGSVVTVTQEFPEEGGLKHYSVTITPDAAAQINTGVEVLSGFTKAPFQVWIDSKTMMVTRILTDSSGGSIDLTINAVNQGVVVEAPTDAKSLEDMMKEMFSSIETTGTAGANASSTITTAVTSASKKANAAKGKAILYNMRSQAELYSSNEGSGLYGTTNTTVGACTGTGAGSMFTSTKGLKALVAQLGQTIGSSTQYRCQSTGIVWAVSANIPDAGIFCVDSTGYGGPVKTLAAADDGMCE